MQEETKRVYVCAFVKWHLMRRVPGYSTRYLGSPHKKVTLLLVIVFVCLRNRFVLVCYWWLHVGRCLVTVYGTYLLEKSQTMSLFETSEVELVVV